MKENPLDNVLDKVMNRQQAISETIARRFKKTAPFASMNLSPTAKVWAIDNLGYEDMNELRQEFGDEAVGYMLFEINKLKMDGRRQRWQMEQI